jgi:sigma-B regulation protein RsbU (phosphoserine phosphatase)
MMKVLNDRLCERRVDGQYVTLLLVRWDAGDKKLTFASAGGGLPLLLRDNEATRLHLEGVPLGLLENREYEDITSEVKSGDRIGLFSDGFEDQTNSEGAVFGQTELARCFKKFRKLAPSSIFNKMLGELDQFRAAVPIHDDQSALILKVK